MMPKYRISEPIADVKYNLMDFLLLFISFCSFLWVVLLYAPVPRVRWIFHVSVSMRKVGDKYKHE